MTVDFANILLAGPCNLRCPECIGRRLQRFAHLDTLDLFPLPGQDDFVRLLRQHEVSQVSVTGVNTDPLLYRPTFALVESLRRQVPGVKLSLHTNGRLITRRLDLVHLYDRATVSLPSLRPATTRRLTGSLEVLDLARIVELVHIPLKISILVTDHNRAELPEILRRCAGLGLERVVLRRPFGEHGPWAPLGPVTPSRWFAGQPVVEVEGLEVTLWDFARSRLACLNLQPDGSIDGDYLLATGERRSA